ncbi:MAG: sensor domain-containing diguanylate cyclase [Acidimicrobiales bacterium]
MSRPSRKSSATPREYTSLRTPDLIHPEDIPMATEQALALRAEPGARYRSILRVRHADGRWLWVEIVGRNLLHEPSVQGIVQTLRDISERRRLEEELEHRAHHDGLTGLANRNHFLDQLDAALASDAERLAVLYLDLDGFKAVNDNHGHRCGDQVLRVGERAWRAPLAPATCAGASVATSSSPSAPVSTIEKAAAAVGHRVHAITGPAV